MPRGSRARFTLANAADQEIIAEFTVTPAGDVDATPDVAAIVAKAARECGWERGEVVAGLSEGWTNGYVTITRQDSATS